MMRSTVIPHFLYFFQCSGDLSFTSESKSKKCKHKTETGGCFKPEIKIRPRHLNKDSCHLIRGTA